MLSTLMNPAKQKLKKTMQYKIASWFTSQVSSDTSHLFPNIKEKRDHRSLLTVLKRRNPGLNLVLGIYLILLWYLLKSYNHF